MEDLQFLIKPGPVDQVADAVIRELSGDEVVKQIFGSRIMKSITLEARHGEMDLPYMLVGPAPHLGEMEPRVGYWRAEVPIGVYIRWEVSSAVEEAGELTIDSWIHYLRVILLGNPHLEQPENENRPLVEKIIRFDLLSYAAALDETGCGPAEITFGIIYETTFKRETMELDARSHER